MYKQKGLAPIVIILIVIGVLAVAGGIYYYIWKEVKPCTLQDVKVCPDGSTILRTGPNCEFAACPEVKTDETSDWKTYRNEEYGFEVKFPSQWNEYGKSNNGVGFGQNDGYGFDIAIILTTKTLEQYLSEKDQEIAQHESVISIEWTKNITISGLSTVQRGEFANVPGWENIVTYVPRNGIIYQLTKVGRYSGSLADRLTYDKILSTFKFIK